MTVTYELIDNLLADYKTPEDLMGENGLLKQTHQKTVRASPAS
jgi:putative transposase